MNLFLLRHGIAVEPAEAASDPARTLSAEGKKKMKHIARGMKALELSFDLVLSSPYARARETAEIVAGEFGILSVLEFTPLLEVGGDPSALLQELAARGGDISDVLLVGHEPQLSRLISHLLSGNSGLSVTMKKGGLCKLDVSRLRFARSASLEWLLMPSQLARLGV